MSRTIRHTLGVVPSTARNDALPTLRGGQVSHLVVGAAQLEGEDGEEVLPFQEDFAFEAVGEVDGGGEWGFRHDVVNTRGED